MLTSLSCPPLHIKSQSIYLFRVAKRHMNDNRIFVKNKCLSEEDNNPLNVFKAYKGLSREIYYLCFARTINSMGDFVFSLITLYLTIQLDMSAIEAGVFVSLAALISGPGVLLGGYLSDSLGKKEIILTGQFISFLLVLSCVFLPKSVTIGYVLIVVLFFMSITRPAYNALIIELAVEEKQRKSAFSLMYLGANLGVAIGPLLAGFFIQDHINLIFLSISVIFLVSTIVIFKFVKISSSILIKEHSNKLSKLKKDHVSLHKLIIQKPLVTCFIIISFLNYFIYMQSSFSIPIQMNFSFGEEGPAYYGSIMTINALCIISITTLVLSITKKVTPLIAIASGAIFYGLGFGILGLIGYSNGFIIIIISTILWSIGEILIQTNINIHIASRVPNTHQGRFNGFLLFIGCLGYTLSPYFTGVLIKSINIQEVWFMIFGISVMYSLFMLCLFWVERKLNRRKLHEKLDFL